MTEFLSKRGVEFTSKNVREDEAALKELIDLGSQATPTTTIDGEIVIGFDEARLTELIQ